MQVRPFFEVMMCVSFYFENAFLCRTGEKSCACYSLSFHESCQLLGDPSGKCEPCPFRNLKAYACHFSPCLRHFQGVLCSQFRCRVAGYTKAFRSKAGTVLLSKADCLLYFILLDERHPCILLTYIVCGCSAEHESGIGRYRPALYFDSYLDFPAYNTPQFLSQHIALVS
jgi:hypothetical protein